MALRVVEDLDMGDAVGRGTVHIGQRQGLEILRLAQHVHALVIDVEEILQFGELVCRARLFDRIEGNRDAVPPCQIDQHFRLQRPFDMKMQLRLGQRANEVARFHIMPLSWSVRTRRHILRQAQDEGRVQRAIIQPSS
jgi:hypothetical protein